jgi:hypothetical protein
MWVNFQKAPETEEEDKRVFGMTKKKKRELGIRGQTRPQEKKKENSRNIRKRIAIFKRVFFFFLIVCFII